VIGAVDTIMGGAMAGEGVTVLSHVGWEMEFARACGEHRSSSFDSSLLPSEVSAGEGAVAPFIDAVDEVGCTADGDARAMGEAV